MEKLIDNNWKMGLFVSVICVFGGLLLSVMIFKSDNSFGIFDYGSYFLATPFIVLISFTPTFILEGISKIEDKRMLRQTKKRDAILS